VVALEGLVAEVAAVEAPVVVGKKHIV